MVKKKFEKMEKLNQAINLLVEIVDEENDKFITELLALIHKYCYLKPGGSKGKFLFEIKKQKT